MNTLQALSTSSIVGTNVYNRDGESLGDIKDLMIDTSKGRIAYAVLSFGGFLGIGDKYFAMPWEAFTIDTSNERFILNVDKERLENAPGFNKDNWPDSSNHDYLTEVYNYYNYEPYWKQQAAIV